MKKKFFKKSQELETTQASINRWMKKQNAAYAYI